MIFSEFDLTKMMANNNILAVKWFYKAVFPFSTLFLTSALVFCSMTSYIFETNNRGFHRSP